MRVTSAALPYQVWDMMNQVHGRLVGGAVRDLVMKKKAKDYDLCTPLKPDEVKAILSERKDVKVLDTGLKHGTVTAVVDKFGPIEITTLRKDVETDGRHAVVEFTDSWKEDAARRDFTMNAMSIDSSGTVYDYFEGMNDISNKTIRFIGNPVTRIREDYLRILRFYRFHSKFPDWRIDENTHVICSRLENNLHKISHERIKSEIVQIMKSPNNWNVFLYLDKLDTLKSIIKMDFKKISDYVLDREIIDGVEIDYFARFIVGIISNNKLTNEEKKAFDISIFYNKETLHNKYFFDVRAFVTKCRFVGYSDKLISSLLKAHNHSLDLKQFNPKLNYVSEILLSKNIPEGPVFGSIMDSVKINWIYSRYPEDRESIEKLVDNAIDHERIMDSVDHERIRNDKVKF